MTPAKRPSRSELIRCGEVFVYNNNKEYLIICDSCGKEFCFFSFFTQHRMEECIKINESTQISTTTTTQVVVEGNVDEDISNDNHENFDEIGQSPINNLLEPDVLIQTIKNEPLSSNDLYNYETTTMNTENGFGAAGSVISNVASEKFTYEIKNIDLSPLDDDEDVNDHLSYLDTNHLNESTIFNNDIMETTTTSAEYLEMLEQNHRSAAPPKRFQCNECEKSYNCQAHLTVHQRNHTGERPYDCRYCDKAFTRKDSLNKHERTHLRERIQHKCEICYKIFTRKFNLEQHMLTHNKIKKNTTTVKKINNNTSSSSSSINNNINNNNSNASNNKDDKELWYCKLCGKSFTRKYDVGRHHRHVHENIKEFSCKLCGKLFREKCNLKQHELRQVCWQLKQNSLSSTFN